MQCQTTSKKLNLFSSLFTSAEISKEFIGLWSRREAYKVAVEPYVSVILCK